MHAQPYTYIFGHLNPDTDSICSSIAYADLKTQLGFPPVKAVRLGALNNETKFVLSYFEQEEPPLLTNVLPQLSDLEIHHPAPLLKTDPIKHVWDVMGNKGNKLVPIVTEDGRLEGMISIGDITTLYMNAPQSDFLDKYEINFENLRHILNGKILYGAYPYETVAGKVYFDSTLIMDSELTDKDIVITSSLDMARRYAINCPCGCVILATDSALVEMSQAKGCVMVTNHSLFTLANLFTQAISAESVMRRDNIISFSNESYLQDVIEMMKMSSHRNFPVVDREGRFMGVVSRRHLLEYDRKRVILMDHNEKSQTVEGIEQATILEIIDHHRVADVQTSAPLYIRSEPLGSTATIVYKLYHENGLTPPKHIAGLLLSAILSDTLLFHSPTCTEEDKAAAEVLAGLSGISMEDYGAKMFDAATTLDNLSPEYLLGIDRKIYTFDQYKVYVSQVYRGNRPPAADQDALRAAMEKFQAESHCDLVVLMVTNIINSSSEVYGVGKAKELLTKAFGMKRDEYRVDLPDFVSRKKQLVPKLIAAAQL